MGFSRINADYHIHSKYSSDGHLQPEKIISLAKAKGLKTIAVTDHGTIRGGRETKEKAESTGVNLKVIVGAEINTNKGEVIGLGLTEEVRATEVHEVISEIKGQGAKVYVPHPFDRFRSSALGTYTYEVVDQIDYVEVFNGRCLLPSFDERAMSFAEEFELGQLAGSDTHFWFEMGNLNPGLGRYLRALTGHILTKVGEWL